MIACVIVIMLLMCGCASNKTTSPTDPAASTTTNSTSTATTPWDGNIISNADFETVSGSPLQNDITTNNGWGHWTTYGNGGANYTNVSRADSTNVVSGNYSIRFTNPVNTIYPVLYQYVLVDPGSTYTISASINANTLEQNPLNNEGVKVWIVSSNNGAILFEYRAATNTYGWTNFSSNWSSGAYTCVRVAVAHRESVGTVWFDKLALKKN
ncbi:MAG: carbohydrate binding domain-containing protein [Spirochaetia bacterium]|nr:carbohydrate binding domain-containing protein [Spirochaetia bacterium]